MVNDLSKVVDFKRIKAETVLINGADDTIIDIADVQSLASQIPNCRLEIVDNVGHFLHLENDDVIDVYRELLN